MVSLGFPGPSMVGPKLEVSPGCFHPTEFSARPNTWKGSNKSELFLLVRARAGIRSTLVLNHPLFLPQKAGGAGWGVLKVI